MVKPLASGLPPRAGNHSSSHYLARHPLRWAGVKGIKLLCFPGSLLPLVLVWVHQWANSMWNLTCVLTSKSCQNERVQGRGLGQQKFVVEARCSRSRWWWVWFLLMGLFFADSHLLGIYSHNHPPLGASLPGDSVCIQFPLFLRTSVRV